MAALPPLFDGLLAEGLTAIKKGAKVFVGRELEIGSFTAEEGGKRMTFRVVANTYRVLGHGRQGTPSERTAARERVQAEQ